LNTNIINIYIFFKSFVDLKITADLLADYIILRLLQKFKLKELLRPLMRYINKLIAKNYLTSYKMLIMGRLTRKDRALYQ